jgi:hypothetical protein
VSLSNIKHKLDRLNTKLIKLSAQRDLKKEQLAEKESLLETELAERKVANKSGLFLKAQAAETRKQALAHIQNMITPLIQDMYEEGYGFEFVYNENLEEIENRTGFNIEPKIYSNLEGERIYTSIRDGRGGGLAETTSVYIRIAFLKFNNYDGPIILDEAWSAVSADEKMTSLCESISKIIEEMDLQVILITHRAEMFGKYAKRILYVDKQNGKSTVYPIRYETILEKQKKLIFENGIES